MPDRNGTAALEDSTNTTSSHTDTASIALGNYVYLQCVQIQNTFDATVQRNDCSSCQEKGKLYNSEVQRCHTSPLLRVEIQDYGRPCFSNLRVAAFLFFISPTRGNLKTCGFPLVLAGDILGVETHPASSCQKWKNTD
uniref:Uncharacterized protein n=1 Tax=Micrurus lemniscatus lemniscatus TaxID=129467 RepID=A0A2D4IM06_MICLE